MQGTTVVRNIGNTRQITQRNISEDLHYVSNTLHVSALLSHLSSYLQTVANAVRLELQIKINKLSQ